MALSRLSRSCHRNPMLEFFHRSLGTTSCQGTSISELYSRTDKIGSWGQRGFGRPGYPSTIALKRVVGVDYNLQERLDMIYAEENKRRENRRDIGIPAPKLDSAKESRRQRMEFTRQKRHNQELERASRNRSLKVNVADVKKERLDTGAIYQDILQAADLYGIYDDLFGREAIFTPNVYMRITYDYNDELVTPVHRGNIIKPSEATTEPKVSFNCEEDESESLWTLVMTNPDGHFTEENKEYLHWMVGNIKGNDIKSGQVLCDYLQPFPPKGTGYHRHIFLLYKQNGEIDFSDEVRNEKMDLNSRTFDNWEFYQKHQDELTPCGLSFFQSDWDSSLKDFFHIQLNMKEPRYEYHFIRPYTRPWGRLNMDRFRVAFNTHLDQNRDPKEIQEEIVKKKLKMHHPFKGDLQKDEKFINAFNIDNDLPQWRRREIERERLRQGYYKDMDWAELRRDPTLA